MKINEPFEVTAWGILAVVGVVAAAVASATWLVAKTVESNELEGYRRSKEWKVAEAIASIGEISKVAKVDVEDRKELLTLRQQKAAFDDTSMKLRSQLATLQSERDNLRQSLASIVKKIDVLDIPIGEARFVVPNTIAVGVVSIYKSLNMCEVIYDDSKQSLEVGQSRPLSLGGKEYRLALLKLTDKSCTFSFSEKTGA